MLTGFAIACFSVSAAESELPTLCQRSDKHGQNYLRLQDAKLLNRQTASGRSLSAVELLPEVVWSQRNAFPPRHVRPDIQAVQEQLPSIARQDLLPCFLWQLSFWQHLSHTGQTYRQCKTIPLTYRHTDIQAVHG